MKKVFRLIIACICLVASGYMIKATREIFLIETTVYSFSYLIATLALIYLAYGLLDPILSPRNVDDEDIEYEPAQMSLLKDEPVKDINMPKISEEHNDGLNERNKKKNGNAGAGLIVLIVIIAIIYSNSQKQAPAPTQTPMAQDEKVYNTSKEWFDNDVAYNLLSQLQIASETLIKDVERVEIKLDLREFKVEPVNEGALDDEGIKYKYYYLCSGKYTDKSNQRIHDFIAGIAFEDNDAMKNGPYARLYYVSTSGHSQIYIQPKQ